jgi:hypothetical protein
VNENIDDNIVDDSESLTDATVNTWEAQPADAPDPVKLQEPIANLVFRIVIQV